MSSERLRCSLNEKLREASTSARRDLEAGLSPDKRKINLLNHLYNVFNEMILKPSSDLQLVTTNEKVGVVDDRVIDDPVGKKLFTFSWQGELPDYIKEKWFIRKVRTVWGKLGIEGQERFRHEYLLLGDCDTRHFLAQASSEQLFDLWFDVEVVHQEKYRALVALFSMCNRLLTKEAYRSWAGKFKIDLGDID